MKKFIDLVRGLPLAMKILLVFIPSGIFILIFCHFFGALIDMNEKMTAVMGQPNEHTVTELVEFLDKSILGFNNNPNNWNRIRRMWNDVNRSSAVTTPTKKKLLDALTKRGLYLNNKSIIDNYKN